MRKSIEVNEGKVSKSCDRVNKMLKELNTLASNKLRLIKSDDEMGDDTSLKLGKLDNLAMSIENSINILSEM